MNENTLPVAREGLPFIALFAFVTLIFALLDWGFLTFVALLLTLSKMRLLTRIGWAPRTKMTAASLRPRPFRDDVARPGALLLRSLLANRTSA